MKFLKNNEFCTTTGKVSDALNYVLYILLSVSCIVKLEHSDIDFSHFFDIKEICKSVDNVL